MKDNKNGQNLNAGKFAVIVDLINEIDEKTTNNGTKIGENGTQSNLNGTKTPQKEPKKINGSNTKNGKQTECDDDKALYEREFEAAQKIKGRNPIDFAVEYIRDIWKHRYHTLQGCFQIHTGENYQNIRDRDLNRFHNIAGRLGIKITKGKFEQLARGDNEGTIEYNPIKNYFNKIKRQFDEKTAQTAFDEFVTLTYERIDPEHTTKEKWEKVLRVWLTFSYAQIFDSLRVNDIALAFVSKKQGTGKTLIANALSKPAERLGLKSEPDFEGGRESERILAERWILHDDELTKRKKASASVFKSALSKKYVDFRPQYARNNEQFLRIASFLFCGNDAEYLSEFSRRDCIIRFKEARESKEYFENFAKTIQSDDLINGVWAYAFYQFSRNFSQISKEKNELENDNYEHSEQFLAATVERDLLKEYFVEADLNARHRISLPEDYDTVLTPENEYIAYSLSDITNFISKKVSPMRLDPQKVLSAIKNENWGKSQSCKINGVQKRIYKLKLIKI